MAKIPLTIDPDYCSSWGWYEGCRELIQNWRDGDEYDGYKGTIEHFPRTNKLVLANTGVTIEPRLLLLLGATSKRGTEQRGQFGEGFAIACLALVRAGFPVTIYNGDEVWRPTIEKPDEGHPFEGANLLVFTTRKLREMRTAFTVEVENVSKDVWDVTKKLFLFLVPPLVNDIVEGYEGSVLLGPEYKGKIFSRGIFVNVIEDVECGYDLARVKLDRDRKVVEEWDLRWRLANLLNQAHKKEPEKFQKRIYDMAKTGKADVKSLVYHADAALLKAMRDEFEGEYGANAVPVRHMEDSKELEALRAKTVVVDPTLQDLLEKTGLKAADVKERLKAGIKRRYAWADLSPVEQAACTTWVERVTKSYTVVDFNDPEVLCQVLTEDDGSTLGVSKNVLCQSERGLVAALVMQEAIRRHVPERELCLDLLFK